MLFPYRYVPHKMEAMQRFIDFIFFEVWSKAVPGVDFSFELFSGDPDLFNVMKGFNYSDKKNAEFFYGSVEKIYGHFARLPKKSVRRLKWWYYSNNCVEQLCSNSSVLRPVRYKDIEARHPDLAKDLYSFFTGLYGFDAADLKSVVGDIDDHYDEFVKINGASKCPFCGMNDLFGQYHSKRDAYDHYLPKSIYPFNSINFRNLVPACHHCNSSYKTTKDPKVVIKDPVIGSHRRKVFYPYATAPYVIEVGVQLFSADISRLGPDQIGLSFGPALLSDEIGTWRDVYGIEERYRAKLCSSDAKAWVEEVRIMQRKLNASADDCLDTVREQAEWAPYANNNFLKVPFLDACNGAGVFSAMVASS